jgi:transglutaminase-like putative cysteine protease
MRNMARKEYTQKERQYVPEYVNKMYPNRVAVFYNMAVGPAPEQLKLAHPETPLESFRRWRFWIDAVVILRDRMVLIEGKIRKVAEGLGQLQLYRDLLPQTPELQPYARLPVECRLVVARPDPRVIELASKQQVIIDVYRPDWVIEYLKELGMA